MNSFFLNFLIQNSFFALSLYKYSTLLEKKTGDERVLFHYWQQLYDRRNGVVSNTPSRVCDGPAVLTRTTL